MKKEERITRIIARGEFSDHCHVITGNATVERIGEDTFINVEDSTAVIRHLLESRFLEGEEIWTQEHADINLWENKNQKHVRHGDVILEKVSENKYKFIQEIEYDPFDSLIRRITD